MTVFQNVIMCFYDMTAYILLSKKVFRDQVSLKQAAIVGYPIALFIGVVGYYIQSEVISLLFNAMWLILILKYITRRRWHQVLIAYFSLFVVMMGIQFLIIGVMSALYSDFAFDFFNGMIAQNLFIAIVALIYFKLPIEIIADFVVSNNRYFKVIIGGVFVIAVATLGFWYADFDQAVKNYLLILIIAVTMFYVVFNIMKFGLVNKARERELALLRTYNPIIEELIDEIRARQHEFDNHLQALKLMVAADESDSELTGYLNAYIGEMRDKTTVVDLIKFDDKVVASLLYSKLKRSHELGVELNFDLKQHSIETQLRDGDVVEILGILLDNAIETGIEDNQVRLSIQKKEDMNLFVVKNKHPYLQSNVRNCMFKKGFSTKNGHNRGYGLFHLRKLIETANGNIEVINEEHEGENFVSISVMFQ